MNKPVKFELAKLLKEKGFQIAVNGGYNCDGKYYSAKIFLEPYNYNELNKANDWYSAPTIAEVVMWLYEKHKIYIHISPHGDEETSFDDCKWWFSVYKDKIYNLQGGSKVTEGIEDFNSPTEAYEAAIEYTLNNLI